jgi:hypothetical protein
MSESENAFKMNKFLDHLAKGNVEPLPTLGVNQKQELSMTAMYVNGSGQNE